MITLENLYWVLGEQELGPLESYFAEALRINGKDVNYINIHSLYPVKWKKLSGYSHRLPRKFDNSVQRRYSAIINNALLLRYNKDKPSHIFIYNDCRILPETLKVFKNNGTKIIVFLGDDPNYLFPGKKTFLLTVMNADKVIVHDTGWIAGLKMLDIKNIIYSPVGTNPEIFFPMNPTDIQLRKYESDILFVGTGYYLNSWGIKRSALLNELCGFKMKIFGDTQWKDMFTYFPELSNHYVNESLSVPELNAACNCSKIYPVVVNSGIVNGVSTRVFDCIASEIFILAEYKKDFDDVFPDNEVVCFKSKSELKEKVSYYLRNENEMKDHVKRSKEKVLKDYTLPKLVKNILEQI